MQTMLHRNAALIGGAVLGIAVVWSVWAPAVSGGQTRAQLPPLSIPSLGPTESFAFYCAPCHGRTGAGDGTVASALRVRPADLTALTARNGGRFPRERVRAYIVGQGRPIPAHGAGDMPVWGPAFRALDASDTRAQVRIDGLVGYLESIQHVDTGAQLYRDHCASCHGSSGRGDGPVASQLRKPTPDLTQFTRKNGGVFPSEQIHRIIDGRGMIAHGDRDMPVWGATFKHESRGGTDEEAAARIDALVRYLKAIQERPAE